MNIIHAIKKEFFNFAHVQYHLGNSHSNNGTFTLLTDPDQQQFGDISSNIALVLAKQLNKNPREIAQQLATFRNQYVQKIECAGPGFINMTLTKNAYSRLASDLLTDLSTFLISNGVRNKKHFSIEFVSANPTGPLHLGHGRGGIIGDVLSNVLRFLGHTVTKEYYINDAGSQIQKLGNSFKIRCQQQLGSAIDLPEDAYHGEYLIDLAKQAIADYGETITTKPNDFFAQYAKEHILTEIHKTLQTYGITFDIWFSEKVLHTDGSIARALSQLERNNTTYSAEDALWFAATRFGDDKDRVLRKSNGELTYIAADVAYTQNKLGRADHLIFVLGQDHHSYVVRLKGITQALGYDPNTIDVILYQLITLQEGGQQLRMSKRAGTMVSLQEVIEKVGTDVARFFFLHRKADAHLDFNMDLALKKTDENPVYYIQYAYVRTKSIAAKALEKEELTDINSADAIGIEATEYLIIKKIISLHDVLTAIASNYQTHILTYYVIELAQIFHAYYGKHKIIDMENVAQSRARLLIVTLVHNTLELCLELLGLSKPQSM